MGGDITKLFVKKCRHFENGTNMEPYLYFNYFDKIIEIQRKPFFFRFSVRIQLSLRYLC